MPNIANLRIIEPLYMNPVPTQANSAPNNDRQQGPIIPSSTSKTNGAARPFDQIAALISFKDHPEAIFSCTQTEKVVSLYNYLLLYGEVSGPKCTEPLSCGYKPQSARREYPGRLTGT